MRGFVPMQSLLILGLLVTLAPSCGGGADGAGGDGGYSLVIESGTGAGIAPCTLLSPSEWAPLMDGTPVVEERTASTVGFSLNRCDWTYNENGAATGIRLQWSNIAVAPAGAYSASAGTQAVAIGDEGWARPTDTARTLDMAWRKGAWSATLKYSALLLPAGKTWPELRDAAIELARLAALRMP